MKFLLLYPKKCPFCRADVKTCYSELKINVTLDAISYKYNPSVYNKMQALNKRELRDKKIFEKLAQKYLDS